MKAHYPKNLKAVVWKEGRYYVSQCLNVDVSSFGKTKKQALSNLQEALELYFEDQPKAKLTVVERPELAKLSLANA
jgi:predicted RNase H-like HicB family nuclease